jgi:hypothetical protein
VDIVGWSQGGGVMPRQYLEFDGGARYVHDLVGLAASDHGTTLDGLFALINADTFIGLPATTTLAGCPACTEQQVGSSFLERVNAAGDTVPGVRYNNALGADDPAFHPTCGLALPVIGSLS